MRGYNYVWSRLQLFGQVDARKTHPFSFSVKKIYFQDYILPQQSWLLLVVRSTKTSLKTKNNYQNYIGVHCSLASRFSIPTGRVLVNYSLHCNHNNKLQVCIYSTFHTIDLSVHAFSRFFCLCQLQRFGQVDAKGQNDPNFG